MAGLTREEQEVHINFSRDDDRAELYSSNPVWINKLDKLVQANPDIYKCIRVSEWGKTYTFPVELITLRKKKKEVSEEQRLRAKERFTKMWQDKQQEKNN